MKTRRGLVVWAVVLLLAQVVRAADSDVSITADKKRVSGAGVVQKGQDAQKRTQTWAFTVTVQNQHSQPLANLDAKYIIFYKTQKLGDKATKKLTKAGDHQIDSLPGLGQVSFDTDTVSLTRAALVGAYFANGAKGSVEDTITGIWVRIYSNGNLFAEFAYPSGLTSTETWQ